VNLKTGKRGKKTSWLGEVYWGGDGRHWTAVTSKNKKFRQKLNLKKHSNQNAFHIAVK
jgi:hypothetical protein